MKSATARAFEHVKGQVLSGALAAGTMTSEGEIAAELGISRTPAREAFLRLEAEGLMRLYPKRGALIVPISPAEADEVFEARRVVESHAARSLTGLRDEALSAVCARLEDIIEAQRSAIAADDLPAYAAADAQFHHCVIAAAGNSLLTAFAAGLRERQQRLAANSVSHDLGRAEDFRAAHAALLSALRERRADDYAARLAEHFATARAAL
ncbi:FCD domain-containing protein [Brevibacterium sp. 5221]|uniref:FCD domain-containing protein n=1 Tax=Brevibacterium rongguiense TaxID=2695267 RepID=A0A6N9H834_9MICO|nr:MULTISPECIES: GntR family transcriptional regulator [Brevibacterium]MYM20217.1 FCD domain-containing protein [Brevibacterium rongguiense]WAL41434.1 GntR family transcriptional regulator [Brevibacterium sp. BRM-1]